MRVKENLPIMVLVEESPQKLRFQFSSRLWGYLTLCIGFVLGIATYFAFSEEGDHWIVTSLIGLLSLVFSYSSIYSFNLHRSLAIDRVKQSIRYVESSLYRSTDWQKGFQEFEKITTFRPITTAGTGGAKKAKNWAIQLISKEGEIFAIGYNQFGALNRQQAERLVTRVADFINIPIELIDD